MEKEWNSIGEPPRWYGVLDVKLITGRVKRVWRSSGEDNKSIYTVYGEDVVINNEDIVHWRKI